MGEKRFNFKRSPVGQVRARVDSTCRAIVRRSAGGNINVVTLKMAENAARQNGLPTTEVITKLRSLGAKI
jgi:hypothetical protein